MRCNLLRARNTALLHLHVELVDLACGVSLTEHSRRQVEELVLALLGKVNESRPLRLDLVGWLS